MRTWTVTIALTNKCGCGKWHDDHLATYPEIEAANRRAAYAAARMLAKLDHPRAALFRSLSATQITKE